MSLADDKPPKKRKNLPPPKPKAYHITEPQLDRGLWCFWLAAENDILDYVQHLNCILQPMSNSFLHRRLKGRVMFAINPRYDHEEAWLWINDLLESEGCRVELDAEWESAIEEAQQTQPPEE